MALVLASKSPRRRQLMALVAPNFLVTQADIAEDAGNNILAAKTALHIARQKAQNAALQHPQDIVIGCDTVVEINGMAVGKPHGKQQAIEMLKLLRATRHWVHTGVCVMAPNRQHSFCETTAVDFAYMPDEEIKAYAETSEPYDKAGAYGVQGWAARYITRIEGCYYNVMGLPVARLAKVLEKFTKETL